MAELIVRQLGMRAYTPVFEAMKLCTGRRTEDSPDEFWFLQHEPVYTQGRAGKTEYLNNTGGIPVVDIDRGGQVTYHGPGQLTVYLLLDLKRMGIGVRELVTRMEQAVIGVLANLGIDSSPRSDAPGVYVDGAKIAALGLRISKGRSYHGLNFNIDMDMSPWAGINPCGLGVPVTQLSNLLDKEDMPSQEEIENQLLSKLMELFGYTHYQLTQSLAN